MKRRQLTPFGAEIKKALVDKRMTQRELAGELGIAPCYLNFILHGERPADKYLPNIIAVLGIDPKKVTKLIA